jgi:hypothetical protein
MYNPKKPKKWGYKMCIIFDVKSLVYNFELYTGKEIHPPHLSNIGAGWECGTVNSEYSTFWS